MRATEAFVDITLFKRVHEVREAWYPADRPQQRGRRNRGRARGGAPPGLEELVTAVKVLSENGTPLWTIFAKGNVQWMQVVPDAVLVSMAPLLPS